MEGEGVTVESATGDADVEIARIEAETEVAIAEIQAETTEAIIEAQSETSDDGRDVEWLVAELAGLRTSLATQEADLSALREQLTVSQTQQAETAGLLAGLILANQSTQPPPSEETETEEPSTPTEADTGSGENTEPVTEEPPADKTPKAPARRPIVRM